MPAQSPPFHPPPLLIISLPLQVSLSDSICLNCFTGSNQLRESHAVRRATSSYPETLTLMPQFWSLRSPPFPFFSWTSVQGHPKTACWGYPSSQLFHPWRTSLPLNSGDPLTLLCVVTVLISYLPRTGCLGYDSSFLTPERWTIVFWWMPGQPGHR